MTDSLKIGGITGTGLIGVLAAAFLVTGLMGEQATDENATFGFLFILTVAAAVILVLAPLWRQ